MGCQYVVIGEVLFSIESYAVVTVAVIKAIINMSLWSRDCGSHTYDSIVNSRPPYVTVVIDLVKLPTIHRAVGALEYVCGGV